jgi:PAS domain S-box-containing protein
MFLCPAADAIGQPLDRFIPERFRQARHGYMSALARPQATSRPMERPATLFGLRTGGEEFPFEASISHVEVSGQNLFTFILRDITERKVAEEALRASDAFTRTVLNSLPLHVCVLDKDGVILMTNDAWVEFVDQPADGVFTIGEVGHNYLDLCRRATVGGTAAGQAILKGVEAVLEGSDPIFSADYHAPLPEEERWFLIRVTPLKGAKGVVIAHTDISAQVQMALELKQHVLLLGEKREELESLTGKLIHAQEQERRRIARELHDDFNQRLAALSVDLEVIERAPVGLPEAAARQLAAIRGQIGRLSDDLHDLAYKLHPSLLEHVGLEIAIRDHVAEFTKQTGLPVTCTAREVPKTLPPEIATALFRVMQESLQNVLKHAQATDVTVRLSGSSKGIGVSVRDNGKGFEVASNQVHRTGIGLMSMQERARLLGGFSRIHSCSEQGTKVCAWVPLS